MHPHYVGIYALFFNCPIWAIALILYFVTDVAMHVGRDQLEGLGYQVAYSAKVGDAALVIAVLIAAGIIQRGNVVPPAWLGAFAQFNLLAWGVVFGIIVNFFTKRARFARTMDTYHDVIIAPVLLFFAFTLLPVIYLGGTMRERIVTIILIVAWLWMILFDILANRMNQRAWLKEHLGLRLRG